MTESKKEWVTPELIVLVRNKPEEMVLRGCKLTTAGLTYPNSTKNTCRRRNAAKCDTTNCSSIQTS